MEVILIYETDKPRRKKVKTLKTFAKTIYEAWNYEESVYVENIETGKITDIFEPYESIINNDEWLSEYGLGIKEVGGRYKLYDRSNDKIFENPYY